MQESYFAYRNGILLYHGPSKLQASRHIPFQGEGYAIVSYEDQGELVHGTIWEGATRTNDQRAFVGSQFPFSEDPSVRKRRPALVQKTLELILLSREKKRQ